MNTLYGMLVAGKVQDEGAYAHRHGHVSLSDREKALRDDLVSGISPSLVPLLATLVCWQALSTRFSEDILALDPQNTYVKPSSLTGDLAYSVLGGCARLEALRHYLDKDILDRLEAPVVFDWYAAYGLQLLRWHHGG